MGSNLKRHFDRFVVWLQDRETGNMFPTKGTDGAAHQFASATSGVAVTPSDATVLDFNALWVGGSGDVSIDHTEGGTAVVYVGVQSGQILPISGVRVNAATTATNIVAMKW